jgi:iron(III) transport system permease protein
VARAARQDIRRLDRGLITVCFALLGFSVLYPTVRLLLAAASQWDASRITSGVGYAAIWNTTLLCFATVGTCGFFGTGLALFFSRYAFPGRRVAAALAYLPFTLPPLVGVIAFYFLVGEDGFIPRLGQYGLGWKVAALPGFPAVLLMHTYAFFVFFYAMAGAALESLDTAQIEAARTLGAGRVRTFFKVTLPLLRPSLLGAALLTFMSSAASFSAPYFLGRDLPILSVEVYHARAAANDDAALTLTVCLAAVSLVGLALFRGRKQAYVGGVKGAPRPIRSAGGRVFATAGAWTIVALLLVPHLVIVWLSFIDYRQWDTEIVPLYFTLDNYTAMFRRAGALQPIVNSLWTSALGAAGALAVGLPAAYLVARRRPWGGILNVLVMVPWALPGTVIAMNLITAFDGPWLPLTGTVWLLPFAYYVRSVPLLTRMAGAAIEPFDGALLEAAQTLGASRAYCFRRIAFPLLAPAVVAGCALVFATNLGEFAASILVATTRNKPISLRIQEILHDGVIVEAAAYSVVLTVMVALVFILARRFTARLV